MNFPQMRTTVLLCAFLCLFCTAALPSSQVQEPDGPAQLTDAQKLAGQIHLLKVENAQLRARVAELELSAERQQLVEQYRIQLKASPEAVFDWQTAAFVEPTKGESR